MNDFQKINKNYNILNGESEYLSRQMRGKFKADEELCQKIMAKLVNLDFQVCVKGRSMKYRNKNVAEIQVTIDINDLMESLHPEIRQAVFRDGFDTRYISHQLYSEMSFDPDMEVTQGVYQSFNTKHYLANIRIRVENWTVPLKQWEVEAQAKELPKELPAEANE